MTARVLFVCTANICRSPVAERLLIAYLQRLAPDSNVVVTSAGTIARPGLPAARGMLAVAERWGLPLADHVARRVTRSIVVEQDLIVTMEDEHRSVVSKLAPGVGARTFTVTELASILERYAPAREGALGSSTSLPARVASWHRARARLQLDNPDVADPYGGPDEAYVATAWELADLIERIGPAVAEVTTGS